MFNCFGLAGGLRRAHERDVKEAKTFMATKAHHAHHSHSEDEDLEDWEGEIWGKNELEGYIRAKPGGCIVLIRGFVVDATSYLGEHVSHSLDATNAYSHDTSAWRSRYFASLLCTSRHEGSKQ